MGEFEIKVEVMMTMIIMKKEKKGRTFFWYNNGNSFFERNHKKNFHHSIYIKHTSTFLEKALEMMDFEKKKQKRLHFY